MTPQQLKALLPTSKIEENTSDKNIHEKLYTLDELGKHFSVDGSSIKAYIDKNKINYVKIEPAKFGFHRYYRLDDIKNYRRTVFRRTKNQIINDEGYKYTLREVSTYYNTSVELLNYHVLSKKIKFIVKQLNISKGQGRRNIRHFKLTDFSFLNSKIRTYKDFTLFEKIKLLFGLKI